MHVVLLGTGVRPIPPNGYGGVERTLAEYSHALQAAGHEVEIVQVAGRGRSLDEYLFARQLKSLLAGRAYDVLHASTPVVANRLHLLGRPYVYTTHSRHWFERRGLSQRWGFWLERRAVRHAVHTIALTPVVRDAILRQVGSAISDRVTVIPIGVDLERFRPSMTTPDPSLALGVGVIDRIKRWELAAAAIRGTGVQLRLCAPISDPSYAQELRRGNPQVQLLGEGNEADFPSLFQSSSFLIHPSRVELLSGAVLQALASGLPVIGAAPLRGVIRENETGWTCDPRASDSAIVEQMRSHVVALRDDPELRRRMSLAARASAEQEFDWKRVVERHVALYQHLLDTRALSPTQSPAR
ncbi:MAG: glycosyltransferase family 4 protein [Thermoplasmata archaeon]